MTARLISNGGRSGSSFSAEISSFPKLDSLVSDWAKQLKELDLAPTLEFSRRLILPGKWHVREVKAVEERRRCSGRRE